ncbi:hypothetical protein BJ165DRAFT_1524478 [Panaeolus papilionaceus]|nr:hypothetical protein BJ165DRAFT_1524478 [Panaeolus papilionaceus]
MSHQSESASTVTPTATGKADASKSPSNSVATKSTKDDVASKPALKDSDDKMPLNTHQAQDNNTDDDDDFTFKGQVTV